MNSDCVEMQGEPKFMKKPNWGGQMVGSGGASYMQFHAKGSGCESSFRIASARPWEFTSFDSINGAFPVKIVVTGQSPEVVDPDVVQIVHGDTII